MAENAERIPWRGMREKERWHMLGMLETLTRKCAVGQEHVSLLFPCRRSRLQAAPVAVGAVAGAAIALDMLAPEPEELDEMACEEREALAALGDFFLPSSYGRTEADDDEDDWQEQYLPTEHLCASCRKKMTTNFECEDCRRERRKQGY